MNAFVHRDYLLHSDIKIELFDDRLEIVSPGVNCYTVSSKEKDDLESW
ncbi:hypothetical protein PECL_1717 [Pediococcus claussenii ATCC BAA-344]|uniref:Uncharacterized protein n=1 Tax=Pediococcus claussenii (strain ATCC BAA-344 / DSM 14800 / JCM 18046 / KCTC 3811 / LMG 21948 / P06) TaxID=701521 RepID=G8PBE5_PEDCP|nr:hypothetical protein PECL_1717 [Pediococcus claussenii ATCC BAA-344]